MANYLLLLELWACLQVVAQSIQVLHAGAVVVEPQLGHVDQIDVLALLDDEGVQRLVS